MKHVSVIRKIIEILRNMEYNAKYIFANSINYRNYDYNYALAIKI